MKKAVIFDLDGTLSDSLTSIAYSSNLALQAFGFAPFETERFKYFVGDGAAELIRRCLRNDGDEKLEHFEEVYKKYCEVFEQYCMYEVKPYAGIRELLLSLKEKGVRTAVLSNKPHERTLTVIHELFGDDCFDFVQGQVENVPKKPAPDGAWNICKKLSVSPEECIYCGDTNTDMKTGKSAGMFTIGVLWGFREKEELVENHADAIVETPQEIMDYL